MRERALAIAIVVVVVVVVSWGGKPAAASRCYVQISLFFKREIALGGSE
jgi:hypothetical protein